MIQKADAFVFARGRLLTALALIGMTLGSATALGAPSVQQVSGALDHNGTITITGSSFGAKSGAAPLVWDNATGSAMSEKWDGA